MKRSRNQREPLSTVLTIKVEGQKHRVDFDQLASRLKIDPVDIDTEAADQPSLYVWVGVLAEEAAYAATLAKRRLDLHRSTLIQALRSKPPKSLQGEGKRAVANAAFEAAVDADARTQELVVKQQAAQRVANLMAIAKEAARSRAGLIREIASKQRQETGSGL